ncbi:unnamed protein product [Adineta steineri]|uniref:B box-type domain-containing protein n=1 Tax=Adineta steineri TaxID=433720 RepID=A0A815K7A0_9BILA|nr:unnamed protein product [Adineta steineri]CAF1389026.1 unnamed protein product [Adineta steineri]CAF1609286.1 unnamed protein product [Adineta steineri]CAF1610433.1 unnamed protein product [Adineta steineri]
MEMTNNKTHCFTCNKEKITYSCKGCSKEFCSVHLTEHQQNLNEELGYITNEYNELKQKINEQKQNPQNFPLIKQINQWEINSIQQIQHKALEYREIIIKYSQTCINDIELKFNDLNEQIKQIHRENEFNEINLNHLKNQLMKITQELNNPSNISIQQNFLLILFFIKMFYFHHFLEPKFNKWKQNGIAVAGGNEHGQE